MQPSGYEIGIICPNMFLNLSLTTEKNSDVLFTSEKMYLIFCIFLILNLITVDLLIQKSLRQCKTIFFLQIIPLELD